MSGILDMSIIRVLAQTMGYTAIWGSIIIIGTFLLLQVRQDQSPRWKTKWILRGMLSIISLMVMFFCIEYLEMLQHTSLNDQEALLFTHASISDLSSFIPSNQMLVDYKDVLIWTWFFGALVLMIRFLLNYGYAKYLIRTTVWNDDPRWSKMIKEVSAKLAFNSNKLRLGFSKVVDSPVVIGFAKPVILFPIGLINHLSIAEVESVLAHEIAHLARRDHLISGIMTLLEIVLYFHPGIWWLNAQMKKYREEDCDDKAINATGDEMTYVKTLVKLKEYNRHTPNDLMLALNGGSKSNFYNRIKRLLDMDVKSKSIKGQLFVLSSIILLGLFFMSSTYLVQDGREEPNEGVEFIVEEDEVLIDEAQTTEVNTFSTIEVIADTLPKKKSSLKIIKKENDEEVELELKNGEIVEFKINGEDVPEAEYEEHESIIRELKDNDVRTFILGTDDDAPMRLRFEEGEDGVRYFNLEDDDHFILGDDIDLPEGFRFSHSINSLDSLFPDLKSVDSILRFSFGGYPTDNRIDMRLFGDGNLKHFELNNDKMQEWFDSAQEFQFPEGQDMHIFKFDSDDLFDDRNYRLFDSEDGPKWLEHDKPRNLFDRSERNLESLIGSQLNRDGFLIPNKENKVLLTGKYMKINGEKQPSNIWNKYKRLFEEETGVPLHKKSRLEFSIIGKESNKRYKAF